MEKRVCHYPLKKIKELIIEGKFSITKNAQKTAIEQFGYGETEIINEVLNLHNSDFFKSMTSHNNHLLWHDVYKKESNNYKLYIKIQISNSNTLVISFKGDENI
ncbi:type II toxin-antitoxin system MqsR family toxin [Leptospira sp. 85282-16]|uniref:Type II toxin-antitoxin system MqsR family toxin n=2 Tax=Leptospira TaxID=171 RepID=A0AAW5VTW9_9LEPT|nr:MULTISPECIES: type II toxin-antitoxin system MqsR family toxin [Leptospira]MCT8335084.1 type II toxin-antitoxin system MqsR family toxin [Leptospira sp. 85282-16]MCW7494780.1 type II toxin-antitoxin system MqsR family toxin [Leptospira soteropolitanensis]MCW7502371.1 type II toxin-antitoxin system MqsR family toxin [Leptospira soteropolitanensis]MCW7524607.1 type II toxin-antitoxin system MqsR family toxin [Leptospira soteropolitanensis]MCW7528474.1 type II toxin-antitoxin system MqsR famil